MLPEDVMSEVSAPPRRRVASFWGSLFHASDGERDHPFLAISAGSVPNAGESMEQRRARIQATVDAIFAPPHPEEFRSTYFRFWGGGS
jgi:hypothetical protein